MAEAMERSQFKKDDGRVRLSHELSEGEKEATGNRKAKVLECLKSLNSACAEDNMPNIAVLGSGGGLRAMIALLGTLVEMKKQGLLDAIMYLCGVSGSTWCMSFLYQENDWTEKVQVLEERLCDTLSKPPCDIQEEFTISTQAAEDELFSLTDVWASFFVYPTLKLYDETKLSEHDDSSKNGKNPYPIYAAIEANQLGKAGENSPGTWFEFTPHESGFPGLGAFVCTEDLGKNIKDGNSQKRDEKNICYLQGLWGSALGSMAANKKYLIDCLKEKFRKLREHRYAVGEAGLQGLLGSMPFLDTDYTSALHQGVLLLLQKLHAHASAGEDCEGIFRQLKEVLKEENSKNSYLKCCDVSETQDLKSWEERMVEFAELILIFEKELGENVRSVWQFLWKTVTCICYWTWGYTNNFLYTNGKAQSTGLTNEEFIHLIDAGIAINSAYPLVLRPERKVKLILSFDFSDGDPFETIKKTAKYCQTNNIPFPEIKPEEIKDIDNPSDCYIFKGIAVPAFKGKDVPTVMHFPLFNNKNCPDKIKDFRDTFTTFTTSYSEENVKVLLKKAKMNVSNNKDRILKEIQQIVSSPKEF
ncbi:cytosolic phospholipase A2 gamma-like [Malaclemys terrapin pileata]|uniref:cytosolic phospholipase A2 gamma-like n=1 Tax=Malaclemys terrapin pileata TaxID=2991368 RepID=UPI0023A7E52E|nr:cytosolic phospholipase A2 gamma-like [Malaclemys terrapin pileata]